MDEVPLSEDETTAYLRVIERHMRVIVNGSSRWYEAGREIWGASFERASRSPDLAHPLWLIWGALTDRFETKRVSDSEAATKMFQAAHEWLALPAGDDTSRSRYLERWVYEEIGYDRPTPAAV